MAGLQRQFKLCLIFVVLLPILHFGLCDLDKYSTSKHGNLTEDIGSGFIDDEPPLFQSEEKINDGLMMDIRPGKAELEDSDDILQPATSRRSVSNDKPLGLATKDEDSNLFTIGVILPFKSSYDWSAGKAAPAVYAAVEEVAKILPERNFKVVFRDSGCSEIYGPVSLFDLYANTSSDVILGPTCPYSLAPVARLANHWHIPIITPGGKAAIFEQQLESEYFTTTRISGSYSQVGEFLYSSFKEFGWLYPGFLTNTGSRNVRSSCYFHAAAVYGFFQKQYSNDETYKSQGGIYSKAFEDRHIDANFMETQLKLAAQRTRILVMCAAKNTIRDIMLTASDLGYTKGEFMFVTLFLDSNEDIDRPWHDENAAAEENEKAKEAFKAVMYVTDKKNKEAYRMLYEKMTNLNLQPFDETGTAREKRSHDLTITPDGPVWKLDPRFDYVTTEHYNSYPIAFYDAVMLYATVLREVLDDGRNPRDGEVLTRSMWNRTFTSLSGNVRMDEKGARGSYYELLSMNRMEKAFKVVKMYDGNKRAVVNVSHIDWPGEGNKTVSWYPECGYEGELCEFPIYIIVIAILGSIVIILPIAVLCYYMLRPIKDNWMIPYEEIMFVMNEGPKAENGSVKLKSESTCSSMASLVFDTNTKQVFTKTAFYQSNRYAIKDIEGNRITVNKHLRSDMNRLVSMNNDHIAKFVGLSIDGPRNMIITEYCAKGSLEDVLENEVMKMDSTFKFSLIQDLVRGMAFLHKSSVGSHGNLKTSNCVINGRFVLKVTDFGLSSLRKKKIIEEENTYAYYRSMLWTAPELLGLENPPSHGTPKGDVYSFAIICQEILYRNGTFWLEQNENMPPKDILERVSRRTSPPFRPTLHGMDIADFGEELADMIRDCWADDPAQRPDFNSLKSDMRKMDRDGNRGNLLDNLLDRMEQFANNLESLVEVRTAEFYQQKKETEKLLYMMLPKSVAAQLIAKQPVKSESFECVTIYFSDIVQFTKLCQGSTAEQVVALLNDLYTTFDSIIDHFDVYKVETIGDAYMVVSGLPIPNGNTHAREICRMSLALLNSVKSFKVRHKPGYKLLLRIGVHSGPVVSGVVGLKMPRYCLFGDTVNTSSRMESNGKELMIHMSPSTMRLLGEPYPDGTFVWKTREEQIQMKGLPLMDTYWLMGEVNDEFPDFAPSPDIINSNSKDNVVALGNTTPSSPVQVAVS